MEAGEVTSKGWLQDGLHAALDIPPIKSAASGRKPGPLQRRRVTGAFWCHGDTFWAGIPVADCENVTMFSE